MRFLLLAVMVLTLAPSLRADNDDLPNFNAPSDNSALDVAKVNRALGIPVFKDDSLWGEDAAAVGQRLSWPQESQTTTQSSYRLYPSRELPQTIFGARAYSCVLYATKGHPTEVSIVFVNHGDYEWELNYLAEAHRLDPQHFPNPLVATTDTTTPDPIITDTPNSTSGAPDPLAAIRQLSDDDRDEIMKNVQENFEKALDHDTQTITDGLTGLFGDPQHMGFGGGDSDTRERVLRWDWQGHAFLLSSPKDTYVALRIVPKAFADNYGVADDVARDDLKTELAQRVKQSDSGDVVVTDIPMVDQGPKGYCVPATWERYLRYLGIPADMYVLANAAGTSQQGTDLDAMVQNVDSLVTLYHRRIDSANGDLDIGAIAKSIDVGLPLMWCCAIHLPFERAITDRMDERAKVTDWSAWASKLADQEQAEIASDITGSQIDGGHQRMIIGYNSRTNEIAISDSWSKKFAIRWMTLTEAKAINAGPTYVIEP